MSVTVRLAKVGKRGERKFRVIAKDTRSKNKGKVIETIGFVDKINNIKTIDKKRLAYWKTNGAIITTAVKNYSV